MNLVKKLMLFRLFILVIQLKEADNNMQFEDIEKKTHEHDKYITREFNKLTKDSVMED